MSLERKKNRINKKKVLVLCPHPVGYAPGQRLKYEQYFDIFEKAGYEIVVSPFMTEEFQKIVYKRGFYLQKIAYTFQGYFRRIRDLFRLHKFDVVYTFLWVAPFAPPVFEKLVRKFSKRLIYDIDDLVFLNPPSSSNPLIHYLKSSRNHISLMKSADHVITCTPYLDNFVKQYNSNTTDISSTINTDKYISKSEYRINNKPVIGWSGSHSTSKYLHLLDSVFQELSKEIDFKLVVMGDPNFKLNGVDVEAIEWNEQYEIEVIKNFDIGVYPLPDEQWVYGKSGLKALQYMALGVPTVASAIGTIFRIIKNNENGILVKSHNEWKKALIDLLTDELFRRKLGSAAVITVEEEYSINSNKLKYLNILSGNRARIN